MGWLKAAFAAMALLVGGAFASAAGASPAMWLVKHDATEIYLFGTLHALDPATQWRTALYDDAYRRADTVWFEADVDRADPQTVGAIVNRYGIDPARPLSQKLAAGDLAALSRQVDVARIDHLRPWAAALMLSMQPVLGGGARVEAGADLTMTRAARGQDKTIRTFETLEDQARLFASLSEPAEVAYLSQVIHERTEGPRLSLRSDEPMEKAWVDGDLARLGPGLVGDLKAENPAFYDALLRRRNLAWADTLTGEMSSGRVELVNVGALHMVGPDGLPALLAARGYSVTRIQ
jgi:uncharacterized protein YbaP (TraB family)